jgi:uncharacterized protein (TIGR03905 family)
MTEKEILYKPEGVCSKYIKVIISEEDGNNKEDNIIKKAIFMGGCPGNALGLSLAIEGRSAKSVMNLLKDVKCGAKSTSCPAELSKALEEYINS